MTRRLSPDRPGLPSSDGSRRWSARSWALVILAALCLVAMSLVPGPARAQAAGPTTDHPYSDPIFLPLRTPAKVGCTRTACDSGPAHGSWAIDFIGTRGDKIYAAGAGIAHIGGNSGGCSTSGAPERGRWVWIDHGAGVVTHYRHLDRIVITEGAVVTPDTQIGTMGGSGSTPPSCYDAYLHFEVRNGGTTGDPVDPGQLLACTDGLVVSLPALWGGARSWDDPQVHPRPRLSTPSATGDCVGSPWTATPTRPSLKATPGDRTVSVTWPAAPRGTDSVVVTLERWAPSVKRWTTPVYRRLPASSATATFTGLQNGYTYRTAAFFHGVAGNSRRSAPNEVVPAARPGAPEAPRFLTWPQRSYVHYGWHRSADNGSAVTTYTAARRCRTGGGPWGSWTKVTQDAEIVYVNFRGLTKATRCQVKVRGTNRLGDGPYSVTSTISR